MEFELLAPVPAVVLARKLHETPLFSFASVDELFRFSAIARQVRYGEGHWMQRQGAPAEYIQVLVEGRARVSLPETREEIVDPPRIFGFKEVLEGACLRETARAVKTAICLAMAAEDFRTLLSDNIELAEGLFRMLLGNPPQGSSPRLLQGVITSPAQTHPAESVSTPMRSIDKALVLARLPIFFRAHAQELLEIGAIAREVSIEAGTTLFTEADPPSIWTVLAGEIRLETPEGAEPVPVGPGDVMGIHETLTGVAMPWRAVAHRSGRALFVGREELFELLAERTDLLQTVCGSLFHTTQGSGS